MYSPYLVYRVALASIKISACLDKEYAYIPLLLLVAGRCLRRSRDHSLDGIGGYVGTGCTFERKGRKRKLLCGSNILASPTFSTPHVPPCLVPPVIIKYPAVQEYPACVITNIDIYPPNSMSVPFGFPVGDILAVGTLIRTVYKAYDSAPEQFRNFSQEILSLHVVVRKVEDQLGISGPRRIASGSPQLASGGVASLTLTLSTQGKNDLKILYDGLQSIMKELGDLLRKYQHLASSPTISFDRLKWGCEDLVGLRDKVWSNITLLTGFNSTLVKYVFLVLIYETYL